MSKTDAVKMLAKEDLVIQRNVIEQMLLLKLGIKQVGIITFPGALPNSEDVNKRINTIYDERVKAYEEKFMLRKLAFSYQKMVEKAVKHKREILTQVYNDVVHQDSSYLQYFSYAEELQIMGVEYLVRPAIRELVLFDDASLKDRVKEILQFRVMHMDEVKDSFTDKTPLQIMLYPEELKPEYVQAIGRLYGYPQCCIDRYMEDRAKGDNPEIRGAIQHYESRQKKRPEDWAYFVQGFTPCRPDCKAAQEIGKNAYQKLIQYDTEIGNIYKRFLSENAELFYNQALNLREHIISLQKEEAAKSGDDKNDDETVKNQ